MFQNVHLGMNIYLDIIRKPYKIVSMKSFIIRFNCQLLKY